MARNSADTTVALLSTNVLNILEKIQLKQSVSLHKPSRKDLTGYDRDIHIS